MLTIIEYQQHLNISFTTLTSRIIASVVVYLCSHLNSKV